MDFFTQASEKTAGLIGFRLNVGFQVPPSEPGGIPPPDDGDNGGVCPRYTAGSLP